MADVPSCTVCKHPHRSSLEQDITNGVSLGVTAKRYPPLSKSALARHVLHASLQRPTAAQVDAKVDAILDGERKREAARTSPSHDHRGRALQDEVDHRVQITGFTIGQTPFSMRAMKVKELATQWNVSINTVENYLAESRRLVRLSDVAPDIEAARFDLVSQLQVAGAKAAAKDDFGVQVRALAEVAKILGVHAPQRHELTGKDGAPLHPLHNTPLHPDVLGREATPEEVDEFIAHGTVPQVRKA